MSSLRINIGATSTTATGPILYGTVLQRYTGARLESAHNVDAGGLVRDGRFYVAVLVTPLPDGWFHYEYAVHNRDNHGRNGTFRVPLCPSGWVRNAGFEDVDNDPSNDWTIARQGNVLTWDSPAGNAQPWNTIFNFWFDSDAAPENGAIEIVQAMPQVGAEPMLAIPSDVPTRQANAFVAAGCGALALWPNGIATLPSPQLALRLNGVASGAACGVLLSDALTLVPVPTACVFMVPDIGVALGATAVGTTATFPLPMPLDPGLEGADLFLQGVELAVGGALLDVANLSNVVQLRIGNATSGCP
jgi:hypothetical protein